MGNCLPSCFPACGNGGGGLCTFNVLSRSRGDFAFLIEEKQSTGMVEGLLNPQLSYHRLPESQRVSPQSSYLSKDIQLQCLDARALLGRTNTSTPDNSLELEWEHETLPMSMIHEPSGSSWATSTFPEDTLTTTQPRDSPLNNGCAMNTTDSDYSRVSSSANSLEWDSVQNSIHSEVDTIDTDTQFLLSEIDRLTMQALKETGNITQDVSYLDDNL